MKDEYHYTESGLRNVWLASGFRIVRSDKGDSLLIDDIENLHAAIGHGIVKKEKKLTGPEIRFLRTALHMSQNALSRLFGVTQLTVARWEKGKAAISTPADATLRLLWPDRADDLTIGWIASFETNPPNGGRMILRRENAAATVSPS